jgi:hypothetical protein
MGDDLKTLKWIFSTTAGWIIYKFETLEQGTKQKQTKVLIKDDLDGRRPSRKMTSKTKTDEDDLKQI